MPIFRQVTPTQGKIHASIEAEVMISVRPSTVVTGTGAALAASSVLMAFLADHHWLIGYDAMPLFEQSVP